MSQAISPELREWLVAQLAAGHSVPALRASMRAAGWHDAAADVALAQLEAGFPNVEVALPSVQAKMPGPDLDGAPLYSMRAIAACRCCRPCGTRAWWSSATCCRRRSAKG